MAGNVKAFVRFRMFLLFPCEWPGLAAKYSYKFQLCFTIFYTNTVYSVGFIDIKSEVVHSQNTP